MVVPIKNGDLNQQSEVREMRVRESDHPNYPKGSRFDFGYLQTASKEGYVIEILP